VQERVPSLDVPPSEGLASGWTRPAIAGQVPNHCWDHHLSRSIGTWVARPMTGPGHPRSRFICHREANGPSAGPGGKRQDAAATSLNPSAMEGSGSGVPPLMGLPINPSARDGTGGKRQDAAATSLNPSAKGGDFCTADFPVGRAVPRPNGSADGQWPGILEPWSGPSALDRPLVVHLGLQPRLGWSRAVGPSRNPFLQVLNPSFSVLSDHSVVDPQDSDPELNHKELRGLREELDFSGTCWSRLGARAG